MYSQNRQSAEQNHVPILYVLIARTLMLEAYDEPVMKHFGPQKAINIIDQCLYVLDQLYRNIERRVRALQSQNPGMTILRSQIKASCPLFSYNM